MVRRYSLSKNHLRSFTMLSGSLMKQVYCPNPTSTNLGRRKRRKTSRISLRKSSNLEEVVQVRTVLFRKWCVNKWQVVPQAPIPVPRESTRIGTRSSLMSRLTRPSSRSNLKLTPSELVWSHLLRIKTQIKILLTSILLKSSARVPHPRKPNQMCPTGEWASSTQRTMRTTTCMSKAWLRITTSKMISSANSKSRRSPWASMLIAERRRRVVKLSRVTPTSSLVEVPKSFLRPTLLFLPCNEPPQFSTSTLLYVMK